MIYPWQTDHWKRLLATEARLPHALLLSGPGGIGKRDFAAALAARLLCSEADGSAQACGACEACRWRLAGSHPDLLTVTPESEQEVAPVEAEGTEAGGGDAGRKAKASRQIRIDQIRALGDLIALGTHRGGRRLILIQPAEAMNPATANALLKLLEEPPLTTLFILISSAPARLLPTIRSRCRRMSFARPPAAAVADWLAQAGVSNAGAELAYWGGYPLLARAYGQSTRAQGNRAAIVDRLAQGRDLDPVAIAGEWERLIKAEAGSDVPFGMGQIVEAAQKWISDLIRVRAGLAPRFHVTGRDAMQRLAQGLASAPLFDCYNYLLKLKPNVEHPLNPRLFIEDLLIRYLRAVAAEGR